MEVGFFDVWLMLSYGGDGVMVKMTRFLTTMMLTMGLTARFLATMTLTMDLMACFSVTMTTTMDLTMRSMAQCFDPRLASLINKINRI